MYVFNYDHATLRYTGGTPADFCQKRPGEILVPGLASKTAPPPIPPGMWPYYVPASDSWQLRPDEA